jgi:hypothetical protein
MCNTCHVNKKTTPNIHTLHFINYDTRSCTIRSVFEFCSETTCFETGNMYLLTNRIIEVKSSVHCPSWTCWILGSLIYKLQDSSKLENIAPWELFRGLEVISFLRIRYGVKSSYSSRIFSVICKYHIPY